MDYKKLWPLSISRCSFLILLTILFSGIASGGIVTVDHYGTKILVIDMQQPVTLKDISNNISPTLISTDGEGIWLLNTSIYVVNSILALDGNSGVKELRINSDAYVAPGTASIISKWGNQPVGTVYINNTTIVTWDLSKNKPETDYAKMKRIFINNGSITNSTFFNIDQLQLSNIHSRNFNNITITNSNHGLRFISCTNLTISLIKCENISQSGITLSNVLNSEVNNYTFMNDKSFWNSPLTAADALLLTGGNNNYIHYLDITGPRWGGITLSFGENQTVIKDVIIRRAGHNGLDLHGNTNTYVENLTSTQSVSNNFLLTGTTNMPVGVKNVTLKDCVSINSSARGLVGGAGVSDVLIENFTIIGSATSGLQFYNARDIHIINLSSNEPAVSTGLNLGYFEGGTNNVSLIDSVITKSSYKDVWISSGACKNNVIINTKFGSILPVTGADRSNGNYLHLRLMHENASVVPNSQLEITSNNFSSMNGFGFKKSHFVMNNDGYTFLPRDNRNESPVLIRSHIDSVGNLIYPSYDLSLHSPSTFYGTILTDISPDSTWYRDDPNVPTYTITAIILDNTTIRPSIIGFAPSEDNPFVPGNTKKFRVWTDETLTSMKWYVDGSQVSSGSLEYNWNILAGSHTILFEGSNANGAVMQSWSVSDKVQTPAEPDLTTPESSGSGTSFTPSATSFTSSVGSSTTFSVDSEEQFTSSKWYFNGAEAASGTSYTQNWAASGSFTVRFDGVTDLGTLSRTWDVVVSGSEYSDISIIPSASTVKPGETFSLDMYIDPKQPVTGAQFNLQYGTLASVTSVRDGGLFSSGGLTNTFQSGLIDNSAGVLKNVYSAIVGSGTVSTPGSMATVNMVAGSSSGLLELTMSNVVLSDAYSNPAPYDISYASVLVDTAPVFNTIPAMSVEEESALTFTVSATDADGDILTYSCTSLPQGATFDATAKTFRWTPSRGQAGTYSVQFSVTDGYLNDTAATTITVSTLDRTPVISLFEPASGSVFEEGRIIDMRVVAEDPEGKALSYIMTIDGVQVSSSAHHQWVTDYSSAGTHSIGVTVSDGNTQTSRTHTITIKDVHPRWDVNQDGLVNILDITLVGQNYGRTYTDTLPRWDVNQDGIVNVQDMSIVAGRFGETVQ